jgi:DNA polymerase-3 subunit delta'
VVGRDFEEKIFSSLKEKDLLAGSFLFFGESQVGKFTFADRLTRDLEKNPNVPSERLIISSEEKKIGIDSVREIKKFIRSKPLTSKYRCIIIDGADNMTPEAQNATLKIVEEPPSYGLLIFIASDYGSLLPTLVSRLRRIYFPRVPKKDIASWLIEKKGLSIEEADSISLLCFGHPGFALEILENKDKKTKEITEIPKKFNSNREFSEFVKIWLSRLYNNKDKDSALLKNILKRVEASSKLNTNKKLQLKSIPWTH